MNSDYYECALNSLLKTQHKRRLLQILLVIRKSTCGQHQVDNVKKIEEKGSLKYLIGCLNNDSCNIVDITLSILGNIFCISPNCCRDAVRKYEILSQLSTILEKYEEDSIKGRLFRIVGNLNKHDICSNSMQMERKLIKGIVTFLKNVSLEEETRNNNATIAMAIRCLRKFVSKDTIPTFVDEFHVMKVIGQLLVKYASKWDANKPEKVVVDDLLRLLFVLSKYRHAESFCKLKEAENGDPFLSLAELITSYPSRLIKIIFNFARCTMVKTYFPIQLIAEKLIGAIQNVDITKQVKDEHLYKEYLKALCELLEYPVYRADAKSVGGFYLLLKLLECMTYPTNFNLECCDIILSAILSCKYDITVMTDRNCNKIINLLSSKLKWMYDDSNKIRNEHNFIPLANCGLRRKCNSTMYYERKRLKRNLTDINIDSFMAEDSLSERSVSPCSSSDISSNPNSPNYTLNLDDDALSDSDNYSPICSDEEESESLLPQAEECAFSDQEEILKNKAIPIPNRLYKTAVEDKIYLLLKWYVERTPVLMEMANEQLLVSLLKATFSTPYINHRAYNLMLKILCVADYLIHILSTNIVPVLHELKYREHGDKCVQCLQVSEIASNLLNTHSLLADSPHGKGIITYELFRADTAKQLNLMLNIPYVIKNRISLHKLMLNRGGLNTILKLMTQKTALQNTSIKTLSALALQLKVRNSAICILNVQKALESAKPCVHRRRRASLNDNGDVVIFKLDDGSKVSAEKQFLSDRSEYFNILLCGDFKESNENEIELHKVPSRSLQYLLDLLEQDVTKYDTCEKLNLELDVILDTIALAEQYLLTDIATYLLNSVEQHFFTTNALPSIYKWSIESGTNLLRIECIVYALVGNIKETERVEMFHDIFDAGLMDYIVDDVKTLLTRFLK